MTRWGIVATLRASLEDTLSFVAWHLDQGATRLHLYLDEHDPEALNVLKAHPAVSVRHTDAAWWTDRGGRPDKHQVRQSRNANDAYGRAHDLDWLAHIDVDEFLMTERPIAERLATLPAAALCARVRPIESLAPTDTAPHTTFKAFHVDQRARAAAVRACFPGWSQALPGGFLSHVAGKLFVRTHLAGVRIRIHNVVLDDIGNPGEVALPGVELGHMHAPTWERFRAACRFRLEHGSYRSELKPQVRQAAGAPNLHDLLTGILAESGEAGLLAFYRDVCTATPDLCARLSQHGLLRRHDLALAARRQRHFPGY